MLSFNILNMQIIMSQGQVLQKSFSSLLNQQKQHIRMGNGILSECRNMKPVSSPINQSPILVGDLSDPDEPQRSYAYPQPVKYETPCNVSHILSEIPPLNVPPEIQRGKNYPNSYFLVPYQVYYTGQWKKGRPHGVGSAVFQNGSILKATFENGQTKGPDCILLMQDGSFYRGNIQQNKFCGKGTFKQQNGHYFIGDWDHSVPHGLGKQQFANGDSYEGEFVDGVKKGKGIYRWKNHPQFIEYQGQFQDDQIKGNGILKKTQDKQINGYFKSIKDIQNARIISKNSQFRGSVRNGLLEGQGSMTSQSGHKYDGNFKHGQPHGNGTLTLPNGQKKIGNWFKGKLISDYKGLTDKEIEKGLDLIEDQFSSKSYIEDAIQSINYALKKIGFIANVVQTKDSNKNLGQKYLIVDLNTDNKSIVIKQI